MTFDEFRTSLKEATPPAASPALNALWLDAKGDWHAAHEAAQSDESTNGSWVHAYLHRKEGDISNAGYWYRRAGKPAQQGSLEAEWEAISKELLVGR